MFGAISLFSLLVLSDGVCSRIEAFVLLAVFLAVLPLYCWYDQKAKGGEEVKVNIMTVLSLSILFFGINWKHPKWPGAIQRKEAWIWIVTFLGYTLLMFYQETH